MRFSSLSAWAYTLYICVYVETLYMAALIKVAVDVHYQNCTKLYQANLVQVLQNISVIGKQ